MHNYMLDKSYKKNDILVFVTNSMKNKSSSRKGAHKKSNNSGFNETPVENKRNVKPRKEKAPKEKKGFGGKLLKFLWYLIFTGFLLAVAGSIGAIVYIIMIMQELPSPQELANFSLIESTRIYDREGNLLYEVSGDERREKVDIETVPAYCKNAVLAAEDANFYEHGGFSWKGILRSAYLDVRNKITGEGFLVGGSTITQQFVKNAYLTREKTIERKLKELILSMQVENAFTKDEILELYLNAIPFGSNAHGIQTAAQLFFSKNVQDLSLSQCALLASLPQAPSYYSPYGSHTDDLISRYKWVLQRMESLDMIDPLLYETALQEDVLASIQPFRQDINAPHFVFYVKEILEQKYGSEMVEQGGLQVYTSLDPRLQDAAETSVREGVDGPLLRYNATNSALIATNPKTGEILAMVGSRDYFMDEVDGQVNITTSLQQPGSSFKPIVYTGLFAKGRGIGPGSVLYDVETNFGNNYMPGNFDGAFWGPTSIRRALAGSRNIPAIKAGYLAGIKDTIEMGYRMGLSTLEQSAALSDHAGMSYALGTLEVTPLDMAVAFGTLANGGNMVPATPILKVIDGTGTVIEEYIPPEGEPAIIPNDPKKNQQVAYLMNDILSDTSARPPGWGKLSVPGHTVAAKTGTSNAKKNGINYPQDLWTVGYTPSIVTVVWGGNTRNGALTRDASGLMGITPTWQNFMSEALKDTPDEPFVRPEGIVEKSVTKTSGFLPSANTPANQLNRDIFAEWSVPEMYDKGLLVASVDRNSGLLLNEFCPEPDPVTYIYGESHNILFYLNPDDPQFSRWEPPVKAWGRSKGASIGTDGENGTDSAEAGITETTVDTIYVDSLAQIPTESCTQEMLDNYENAPEITFLTPLPNGKISLGQNKVILSIDEHYSLQNVEYYFDNIPQYAASRRPFDEGFITVPDDAEIGSTHTIKVIVIDSASNHKSSSVTVTVATDASPPIVEFREPKDSSSFNPGESVDVLVNAYDERSQIDSIELLFDGKFVINLNSNIKYSYTIPTDTEKGNHVLTARAFDTEGNTAMERVEIRVSGRVVDDNSNNDDTTDNNTDQNNTTYSISTQLIGETFTVDKAIGIQVSVNEGSPDSIRNIKLYANGDRVDVLFGVEQNNTATWIPRESGTYVIYAEANDNGGNLLTTSNSVTINVEDK